MTLKVISLNVEGDRHLDLQAPFLAACGADLICLQEAFQSDWEGYQERLGLCGHFAPMCRKPRCDGTIDVLGVAVLSRRRLLTREAHVYFHGAGGGGLALHTPGRSSPIISRRVAVVVSVEDDDGRELRCATTHFSWSRGGAANDDQRRNLESLLGILGRYDHLVLCGDFNAPRGGEIFARLAEAYIDQVPARFETSIDAERHYAGDLGILVDGLFTTPHYQASAVDLVGGVSDHLAIVASLERVS